MQTIQNYLVNKQFQFTQHQFFQHLTDDTTLEQFASVASHLSFWVMSFQDVLRLTEERITHDKIYHIVRKHRLAQSGHQDWFISGVKDIESKMLTLRSIYSRNYATTRYATYAIMSEVFQARNDYEYIALLLTLESTSNIFLGFTADFVDTVSYSNSLRFCSNYHLEFERNYTFFEAKLKDYFAEVQLAENEEENILKMIDRVYNAFNLMFNGLASALELKPKTEKVVYFSDYIMYDFPMVGGWKAQNIGKDCGISNTSSTGNQNSPTGFTYTV